MAHGEAAPLEAEVSVPSAPGLGYNPAMSLRCALLQRLVWLGVMSVLVACATKPTSLPNQHRTVVAPAVILQPSEILPIYVEDFSLGAQSAPVTVVAFLDLQCPFCAKGWETLVRVQRHFGPETLRIVVKHLPLPFHAQAGSAARRVVQVQRTLGNAAALALLNRVFEAQPQLDDQTLESWARQLAPDATQGSATSAASLSVEEQVQRDIALAARLGIEGTPEFRINGISVPGAVDDSEFQRIIAEELAQVRELTKRGLPGGDVYPRRVAANHLNRSSTKSDTEATDTTRWNITVGDSPQLGEITAPVTIVAFMDYECPYCRRGFETMQQLLAKYPRKLRLVWKHRPLEFHANAEAASALAVWVRKSRGDDAFWKFTEHLLSRQDDLANLTSWSGLEAFGIERATFATGDFKAKAQAALSEDADLADDFEVDGTPQFFLNGLRVKGSRSVEDFSKLIDEEMIAVRQLQQSGTSASEIYPVLQARARSAPEPPSVAEGTTFPDGPSIGAKQPKVTIRIFSDYQCPFCQRGESTIRQLLEQYASELRVIWYDLPLAFHDRARPAATLAREVRRQKGDAAFFRVNRLLFENQADLSEPALLTYAKQLGLDQETVLASRREQSHGPGIDRDAQLAASLGISATPSFVVERYLLEGAQSKHRFERLIRRVLKEKSNANTSPRKH